MDHDPAGVVAQTSDSVQPTAPMAEPGSQVMLAEYAALRSEAERRANVQWNILALQITSAGLIGSLVISRAGDSALLLIIPLSSYMLGSRYILQNYHIGLIGTYIRCELSGRLHGYLAWEEWKARQVAPDPQPRHWLISTGRNFLHPTRLAFEGIASLALAAAPFAIAYAWRDQAPAWALVLGFAVLWMIGALATYFLHDSFNSSSLD